jgi:hypothetical protein
MLIHGRGSLEAGKKRSINAWPANGIPSERKEPWLLDQLKP